MNEGNASNSLLAKDIVKRLLAQRDVHGDIVVAQMNSPPDGDGRETIDYAVVREHEPLSLLMFDAANTVTALVDQNILMQEVLKNRILVALDNAKEPAWVPTHRHYKGGLYRVTGIRWDAEHDELVELIEYDDAEGKRFVMTKRRFESRLDSGGARYEYIYDGAEAHG